MSMPRRCEPLYGDLKQNRFVREIGLIRFRLYNATLRADLGSDRSGVVDHLSAHLLPRARPTRRAASARRSAPAVRASARRSACGLNTIKRTERWSEEAARRARNGIAGGLLDLQAGFYWTHEDDNNRIPTIDTVPRQPPARRSPLPALAIAKINSTYEEYSFFGNARVHFGDKFDVLGGVRYSHDEQNYLQDYQGLIVGPRRLIVPGSEKADITTWLVSPRFSVSDNFMVYGRVAIGLSPRWSEPRRRPPATSPLTFQPDKLTQYEVGFKASDGGPHAVASTPRCSTPTGTTSRSRPARRVQLHRQRRQGAQPGCRGDAALPAGHAALDARAERRLYRCQADDRTRRRRAGSTAIACPMCRSCPAR